MFDFDMHKWRERKSQEFDRSKITLKKAGKEYNVYDAIQEAREDTEIYPTLEKYGCLDKLMLNKELTAADFKEYAGFADLRDLKQQEIKAKQMFYDLPLETRKHFNNDINQFVKDGEKYINDLIKEEQAKLQEQKQTNVGAPDNEQK